MPELSNSSFADIFGGLVILWRVLLFGLTPYVAALLMGVVHPVARLTVFIFGGLLLSSIPDIPTDESWGDVVGFQNELIGILSAFTLSLVALGRSFFAPSLALVSGSMVGMFVCAVSTVHHMALSQMQEARLTFPVHGYLVQDCLLSLMIGVGLWIPALTILEWRSNGRNHESGA